jgi:DNA-binding IclR family transcriptional regulator
MEQAGKAATGGIAGAQAIRRAMDVIRAVAQFQRSGASLSRVAQATGLNASTAFRILRSLTEERMLRYDERERRYYLGLLAFELGLVTQAQSQVQNSWRETIENISRRTRLTTYLMARSDREAVCLLCVQGTMVIRAMPMDVGQRLPLGIGAGSLAILATLEDDEIERILAALGSRLDLFPRGRKEAKRIIERVAATRTNGYSVSTGTVADGLAGVGVAIQPSSGLLQLAISVSAVTNSIDPVEARKIAAVIQTGIRNHRA